MAILLFHMKKKKDKLLKLLRIAVRSIKRFCFVSLFVLKENATLNGDRWEENSSISSV